MTLPSDPEIAEPCIVPGAGLDWDATSRDYVEHRPGYPPSFFRLLREFGIGLSGQDILDLGTGTGALAVPFAREGARVVGVDASEAQLAGARKVAAHDGLAIDFRFALAERTGLPDASFDAITASMCWRYFDMGRMAGEVPRLLRPDGVLLVASIIWARVDNDITRATDALIARYNHEATSGSGGRRDDPVPAWSTERFRLRTYHTYVEPLAFTRESWRGRIRASKWIGAALPVDRVDAFDRELDQALGELGAERFEVPHQITLHAFVPRRSASTSESLPLPALASK